MTVEKVCHRLRIAEVITETADAVSVVFDLTARQRECFAYRPGQFLTLRLPTADGPVARCYSLASSPHTDPLPKITVKRTGEASNWLCDNVRRGAELDALEPAGVFTPVSLDDDLLLVAAGSGITPMMSIAKSVLGAGTGQVVLCYANRDEDAVIFRDELRDTAAGHPRRLVLLHWLESLQGLPTPDGLVALLRGWQAGQVFVCGPTPFMDVARTALRDLGVPRSRVRLERFNSLGGDPFEHAVPAGPTDPALTAALVVEIDGDRHELAWPSAVRLLDLLAANGVSAPTSCGEGVCASCECRVLQGEVRMVNNQVLDDEDIAEGYALACQALPVTETVHVAF